MSTIEVDDQFGQVIQKSAQEVPASTPKTQYRLRTNDAEAIAALNNVVSGLKGSLLDGVKFDEIDFAYPSSTVETFDYKLLSVLQATIQITYTTASKNVLSNAKRTV